MSTKNSDCAVKGSVEDYKDVLVKDIRMCKLNICASVPSSDFCAGCDEAPALTVR